MFNKNKIIAEDIEKIISSNLEWSKFSDKNILITGANGFLPAYMVETILRLIEKKIISGTKVFAIVRNLNKAKARFADNNENPNLIFIVQDVCDPINISEKVDFIIHAASQASPKYYNIDPVGTLSANTIGTANLLKLAQTNNVESFLYFSSSEVYGKLNDGVIGIKENDFGILDPTNVRSCYAESKRMGETMCVSWHHQYKVPVKIARPFHTYGPGMKLDDGRVYADFVSNIVNNQDIIMKSDGLAQRAFCYLSDATIGFFTILLKGKNGEAYNVGNPDCEISIKKLAELLVNLFHNKNLSIVTDIKNNNGYIKSHILRNSTDICKITKLGWYPTTNLTDGFIKTINSYGKSF